MKPYNSLYMFSHLVKKMITGSLFFFLSVCPYYIYSQTDTTATDTIQEDIEEESEMLSPSMDLVAVQKGDQSVDLRVALKAKFKGNFINLHSLKVKYSVKDGEEAKELGHSITNAQGKTIFNVKPSDIIADETGSMTFKAIFEGNKLIEATEEEVSFYSATIKVNPSNEDSVLTMAVQVMDGQKNPLAESVIGIYVKRMFNPLKIGEITTDENGEGSLEIPAGLPGDATGNLTLIAKLDEDEKYGNLETSSIQKWGLPVSDKIHELPRALWSQHPPIWMLVTFILLISVVWGHYFVIIYELFRLRKEEGDAGNQILDS